MKALFKVNYTYKSYASGSYDGSKINRTTEMFLKCDENKKPVYIPINRLSGFERASIEILNTEYIRPMHEIEVYDYDIERNELPAFLAVGEEEDEDGGREVTETFKVYKFDKAPEHVKEKIRDYFHFDTDFGQFMLDERIETLKKLAEELNLELDYSLSVVPDRGEFIKMDLKNDAYDEEEELKEVERRIQEFLNDEADCPLTGVCYDEDIRDSIRKNGGDFEALKDALDEYIGDIHKEYENMCEDEYLSDYCDANGMEFTEQGKPY